MGAIMNEAKKPPDSPDPIAKPERGAPVAGAPDADFPPAGPHARRELTNKMATPGAGALPDPDEEGDSQTSTG